MIVLTQKNGRSSDDAEDSSTGPLEVKSAGQQKSTPHTSNGRRRIKKSDLYANFPN
jgi:hypothetical protein